MMDKDGRGRNRLSHTSAPLSFAKSKRPVPPDLDEAGTANRLPSGQTASRRQRSLQPKGQISKYTRTWTLLWTFTSLCISAWLSSDVDQSTYHGDKPSDLCNRLCKTWKLQVNFVSSKTCTKYSYYSVNQRRKEFTNNGTQPLPQGFNWERALRSKLPPRFWQNQQLSWVYVWKQSQTAGTLSETQV